MLLEVLDEDGKYKLYYLSCSSMVIVGIFLIAPHLYTLRLFLGFKRDGAISLLLFWLVLVYIAYGRRSQNQRA